MKKTIGLFTALMMALPIFLIPSCNEFPVEEQESFRGQIRLLSPVERGIDEEISKDLADELIIEEILDEVIADLESMEYLKSGSTCPVVTVDRPEDGKYPRVITRDFGDGCSNEWGVEKSGKIIVVVDGPWLRKGTKREVTFEAYTRNGVAVSGKKEIVCLGMNEDGLYVHDIKGEIVLDKPNGVQVKREAHKRRTLITGAGDPTVAKEWFVEARVEVEKSTGRKYVVTSQEPLHKIEGCKWYQSGVKKIIFEVDVDESDEGEDLRKYKVMIDYGYAESDAACDNLAMRSVNDGEAEVMTLK